VHLREARIKPSSGVGVKPQFHLCVLRP